MPKKKPIVIGIAGGSGSGKTSVTKSIFDSFRGHSILMLEQDYYYKDQSHLPFEDLLRYEPIEKPIYDYKIHTRSNETLLVEPKDVIILEGILVLEDKRLRDLM